MTCRRCHGLMVIDAYLNLEGDHDQPWVKSWRCVNCGETIDERIMENRMKTRVHTEMTAPPKAA